VITLEDWGLIRRLAAEGEPHARIAVRLGISRTTAGRPGMRLSVTCGSRRGRSPFSNGTSMLLPVLVITAAYSRFVLGRMIPTKTTEDLLLGMGSCSNSSGRRPGMARPGPATAAD
jgi:hypothetical protein